MKTLLTTVAIITAASSVSAHGVTMYQNYYASYNNTYIGYKTCGYNRLGYRPGSPSTSDVVITVKGYSCPYSIHYDPARNTWHR